MGKPAGVRTHALVSLGSAVAVIISLGLPGEVKSMDPNAISRVLQGILTGIGFLGAGVILRNLTGHVTGLTTAATVWLCAVLGVTCGLGYWSVLVIAVGLSVVVLTLGGSDRVFRRTFAQASNRVHQQAFVQELRLAKSVANSIARRDTPRHGHGQEVNPSAKLS
jgi:putative Mg2+ transporter-C (MgtC) family protein